MANAITEELVRALDGFRFVYPGGRLLLALKSGLYDNGRGAIQMMTDAGEPYAVLTVNLPDEELAANELFVRTGNGIRTDISVIRALVATSQLWTPTGRTVSSGYVEDYASVWRFARCAAHKTANYRALCAECRAIIVQRYEADVEYLLASDAVKRLEATRIIWEG